ncbi:MAG TPA: SCO family protein [Pyrinomonadaceae bacterium]|nr:SCO family protein [Pyrinomonadaceae bacterium]
MNHKAILALVGLCLCLSLIGCQNEPSPSPNAKRFDLSGKVISVEPAKHIITVAHEEIKDYMPAMTMPFTVKGSDWVFGVVKPGNRIAAAYVVDGTDSWLEEVVITQEGPADPNSTSSTPEPKPGDEVPNFRLVNQNGDAIRLHDYKGKALLLTFIFTRCQDPNQCTLMSGNFANIHQEVEKQPEIRNRTHLLSITFDPEYDTPKVLRSYGSAYTGKYADETFDHWEFASGTQDEVKSVAQYFGMRYHKDAAGNDQMIHTLATALVGPDSKLIKLYRGNEWKFEDVLRDLKDAAQ